MRKLCLFALPFCGAVFLACALLPQAVLLPTGIIFLLSGLLVGCRKRRAACLVCLGLAIGLLWQCGYTRIFRAPAQELSGQSAAFTAVVTDFPAETSTGSLRITARLQLDGAPDPKILLYADPGALTLQPGDRISGTAHFQSANVVRGEDVTYYEAQGIWLRANVTGALEVQCTGRIPVRYCPAVIAAALKQSIAAIFPQDVSGWLTALLTGDKSALSDGEYTALQRSGAAHIVAVSGLHLSILAGVLRIFFRRHSRTGAVGILCLIGLYCAVTGFPPSVMRAAFMVFMTLLAPLAGREEDPATTLSAALFLLLAWNPYSVLSVSLQLSFASIAGIHLVSEPLCRTVMRRFPGGGRPLRALIQNISVTLGALVFTTPLCAYWFGTLSLIAPLTNLLILWIMPFAFSAGLFLSILGIFAPGFAAVPARLAAWLVRYIQAVTGTLSRPSFSCLSMGSGYLCAWLALVYVILALVLLRRVRRPVLPVCAGVVTLCAALLLTRLSMTAYPLSVTMLDVGQGQCILLCSGGCTALIDCGGSQGNAGDIAADYLQGLGISRLDLLILTHCHSDHANGVPELLARMDVQNLILPTLARDESAYRGEILELAAQSGTAVTLLEDNRALSFGESTLTLYAPLSDGGANEEGLFVLASRGDFDLLITGDANSFVESLLLKYDPLTDIEVLIAGHHGSASSTSELLLDALTPETCLIPVGYNTYGHPAAETLAHLAGRGIDIYRTDLMGNITIRCKGD